MKQYVNKFAYKENKSYICAIIIPKPGKIMKSYAIYLRVSTLRQGQSGLGIEAQRKRCEEFVKARGGVVSGEFKDVESGKSRTRKGLWDAIDFCKANGCALVIYRLDRLARDVEFTFRVINTGIEIHFTDMPMVNTMILGVFASVAQYERELCSTRTKEALRAKRTRGEALGGDPDVWGRKTGTSRPEVMEKAQNASADRRRENARMNPNNRAFAEFIEYWEALHGKINANTDFHPIADKLNERGKTTATGLPFTAARARAMYDKTKNLYA